MAGSGLFEGFVLGVLLTLLFGAPFGLGRVYTGSYDAAATDPHATVIRRAFNATFHQSIERHAGEVVAPEALSPHMMEVGASVYASIGARRQGAPKQVRSPWATEMRPEPPEVTEAAAECQPEEVFWIVRHGIRMSGMTSRESVLLNGSIAEAPQAGGTGHLGQEEIDHSV